MAMEAGAECGPQAGAEVPLIDRARCEGKADCVRVCPYAVFEVRRIEDTDFAALSWFAKFKCIAHGRRTAYTPRAAACRSCAYCVEACPERAIRLVPAGPA